MQRFARIIGTGRYVPERLITNDELSRRLDCLWRYDQYIANAGGRDELQEFWRGAKSQDQRNIDQIKKLIRQHVQSNCF